MMALIAVTPLKLPGRSVIHLLPTLDPLAIFFQSLLPPICAVTFRAASQPAGLSFHGNRQHRLYPGTTCVVIVAHTPFQPRIICPSVWSSRTTTRSTVDGTACTAQRSTDSCFRHSDTRQLSWQSAPSHVHVPSAE